MCAGLSKFGRSLRGLNRPKFWSMLVRGTTCCSTNPAPHAGGVLARQANCAPQTSTPKVAMDTRLEPLHRAGHLQQLPQALLVADRPTPPGQYESLGQASHVVRASGLA
jgi:hypothetical protein